MQSAKTHLSRLVEEAAAGGDIVLAKAGRPMVRLVPFQRDGMSSQMGLEVVGDEAEQGLGAVESRGFDGPRAVSARSGSEPGLCGDPAGAFLGRRLVTHSSQRACQAAGSPRA